MSTEQGERSPSGVWIAKDFRDNLIIDRYDPMFSSMRVSKRKHLRSQNSEDAVTWNVFRSLRQVDPDAWLPALGELAFPERPGALAGPATVILWVSVPPPPALVVDLDEGPSEVDVVIESPSWVWFVEAKYRGDISERTTTRPGRDQVLRYLDVGSYYAGVRDFYFSLLVRSAAASPAGAQAVERYRDLSFPQQSLALHRPDGLPNLRAVSLLTWSDLARVLSVAGACARRADEVQYVTRALAWMESKHMVENPIHRGSQTR